MKYIYILNTCDDWKSYSSMNIEIVTTSWNKLYKKLKEIILENKLEIGNEDIFDSCKNFPNNYDILNDIITNIFIDRYED